MEAYGEGASCLASAPKGWHDYFSDEEYNAEDRRAELVRDLVEYFTTTETAWFERIKIHHTQDCILEVDCEELLVQCKSPDLIPALELQPKECVSCIAISCLESLSRRFDVPAELIQECESHKLKIRLTNYQSSQMAIRDLKANSIGRLVTIQGTVVRIGGVRPQITGMSFTCTSCGRESIAKFSGGRYTPPSRCSAHGCRGTGFAPVKGSITSIDWQKLRVQETVSDDSDCHGRVPRTVDIELFEDLVDTCSIGDTVRIVGLVKVINADQHKGWTKLNKSKSLFLIYLEANSLICSQRSDRGCEHDNSASLLIPFAGASQNFTMKDLQFIFRFTQEYEGHQFQEFVHALCPSIHGHEMIKASMILALFGGVRKYVDESQRVPVRGDIHILICGDPGTGKSQLLQAVAQIAPKGIYICGNSSTTAGISATVVQDTLTGDFACEAGALVLASGGVCCIDELDKLKADHKALLGAMEQQDVSLSKAGLCCTMPAVTGVIAAANPACGHYQRSKTVMENLKMTDALLSRFDLVFLLLDKPDEMQDQLISGHILGKHGELGGRPMEARQKLIQQCSDILTQSMSKDHQSLQSRLRCYTAEGTEPMWPSLMRTYIQYAREFCKPLLTAEAKQVLKDFYLDLRKNAQSQSGLPITIRQLESLIRLAEARARCDLSQTVDREHALDVVELMKFATWDEWGPACLEVKGSCHRSSGKKAEMHRFIKALEQHLRNQGKTMLAAADMFTVADATDLQVENIHNMIDEMNEAGILEKKGNGMYKLVPL